MKDEQLFWNISGYLIIKKKKSQGQACVHKIKIRCRDGIYDAQVVFC